MMVSVVAVPVADVLTTEAQVPEEIAPVPKADVPLATVPVIVEGKDVPLVFVQVIASDPDVVQSPLRSPFVIEDPPENFVRLPLAGLPVVVTVPDVAPLVPHEKASDDCV